MKFARVLQAAAALCAVRAFAPSPSRSRPAFLSLSPSPPIRSSLDMAVGTVGFDVTGLYTDEDKTKSDEMNKIASWLDLPVTIEPRSGLGDTVAVSGFDPDDPAAQLVLEYLNNEDSPHLSFRKILIHVSDLKLARKRLVGRNARYTGLLDKLDFAEAEESSPTLPTAEQLDGVTSWVAHVTAAGESDLAERLGAVASVAEAASVNNLSIILSGAQSLDSGALASVEQALQSKITSVKYNLLAVGEWNNDPEDSCAYGIVNVTDSNSALASDASFSRAESLRILTECLAIGSTAGKCIVATAVKNKTSVESQLMQTMRGIGYSRPQEVELMVMRGWKGYEQELVDAEKTRIVEGKKREEKIEIMKKQALEQNDDVRLKIEEANAKRGWVPDKKELEERATEWGKKQYMKKWMQGDTFGPESAFIKVVWDRALLEAELELAGEIGVEVNAKSRRQEFADKKKKEKEETTEMMIEKFGSLTLEDIEDGLG